MKPSTKWDQWARAKAIANARAIWAIRSINVNNVNIKEIKIEQIKIATNQRAMGEARAQANHEREQAHTHGSKAQIPGARVGKTNETHATKEMQFVASMREGHCCALPLPLPLPLLPEPQPLPEP